MNVDEKMVVKTFVHSESYGCDFKLFHVYVIGNVISPQTSDGGVRLDV